eukprot:7955590-Alexandrium_andersonii.AAC.1
MPSCCRCGSPTPAARRHPGWTCLAKRQGDARACLQARRHADGRPRRDPGRTVAEQARGVECRP